MPVSHVGLTVSHVPSACSFFLSALQPLGYRYVGNQGDSVGFGTDDADFFLSPEVPGDFYAAALTAGGQPNGSPAFRGCNDCIFNAAVLDLDGNSIEVIYHQIEDDDPYTTVSGGSRVLTWRRGIVNVLGDEDRSTFISTSPNPAPSTAQSTPQSKVPSVVRTASAPAVTTSSQNSSSDNGFQITGKAIIGTILGAAAGAAVAYAMVRSEQDGAQQEAEFAQAISRKAASSRASSKAPSKATPSQAQTSKAKTVYNSATMSKAAPASRISEIKESTEIRPRTRAHRNYSTTESVIASRVMEQFSDDEPELVLRPRKAHSVRAIEAAPEPQSLEEVDARSYHSPTYVSLAPTPRAAKKSEAIYIPASQIVSRAPSRAPSGPPSIAPTERQIEYIPASLATQRPSIVSRRAVTSPSSICHTDRQIEDYEPSAAAVPLPESRKTSLVGSLGLLANDPIPRIDDLETTVRKLRVNTLDLFINNIDHFIARNLQPFDHSLVTKFDCDFFQIQPFSFHKEEGYEDEEYDIPRCVDEFQYCQQLSKSGEQDLINLPAATV
ncbi:unnamed protein product [Aureobasidium pullulans]|nr:unnamed protein product [Aureobasidium pullulans]